MSELEVLRDEVLETTGTSDYHETNSFEIRDQQALCFFPKTNHITFAGIYQCTVVFQIAHESVHVCCEITSNTALNEEYLYTIFI
jgi:hypothetical protein